LQIGDSRFQKEEFRSQELDEQGLGGAARLQIGDSRFQKEELRSQKSETNVSGEHLLPLAGGGKFGSAPGVVPQSGIATSILNV
jgi:hypothetical protein